MMLGSNNIYVNNILMFYPAIVFMNRSIQDMKCFMTHLDFTMESTSRYILH